MRSHLAIALLAVVLSACGASPSPSPPSTVPPPSAATARPVIACLGGVPQPTCDEAARVAIGAVASSGWTPARVWINSGLFCPMEDCLFDPSANFPAPNPPDEGRWAADRRDSVRRNGQARGDEHRSCRVRRPAGAHRLPRPAALMVLRHVSVHVHDRRAVPPRACAARPRLESGRHDHGDRASSPSTARSRRRSTGRARGSSASPMRRWAGRDTWTRCGPPTAVPYPLDPATPITADLSKSGGFSGDDPDADFVRSFLADPEVRLPRGHLGRHRDRQVP